MNSIEWQQAIKEHANGLRQQAQGKELYNEPFDPADADAMIVYAYLIGIKTGHAAADADYQKRLEEAKSKKSFFG